MKKEPIIYHGLLHDQLNIKGLIQAQANEPSFMSGPSNKNELKTKRLIKTKKNYKRGGFYEY